MIKILCTELFAATYTHLSSKYTTKITLETLLSPLLYQKRLRNLVSRGLHLLGKECIEWSLQNRVPCVPACLRACVQSGQRANVLACERVNFSFLRSNVPINVPTCHTACQCFDLT